MQLYYLYKFKLYLGIDISDEKRELKIGEKPCMFYILENGDYLYISKWLTYQSEYTSRAN